MRWRRRNEIKRVFKGALERLFCVQILLQVLDETCRLVTAWLPPGFLCVGPLTSERVLRFEPCLINEHIVEHFIDYMMQQKTWMEKQIEVHGKPEHPNDTRPFFGE